MPTCPRCNKSVPATAIDCPHCKLTLKAHGHPGMTLYRAKDEPLCATCIYDADDSCNFPKRPDAMTCTLYQEIGATKSDQEIYRAPPRPWWQENTVWIALGVLIVVSILITVL